MLYHGPIIPRLDDIPLAQKYFQSENKHLPKHARPNFILSESPEHIVLHKFRFVTFIAIDDLRTVRRVGGFKFVRARPTLVEVLCRIAISCLQSTTCPS